MKFTQKQWTALVWAALLTIATCSPVTPGTARKARQEEEAEVEDRHHEEEHHVVHHPKHKKAILIRQLLPFLTTAFINALTSVLVNWFYPWKVIPPIPGRVGVAQLFGGWPPKALKHAAFYGPVGGIQPPAPPHAHHIAHEPHHPLTGPSSF